MQVYPTSNIFLGPDPNDTLTVDVSNKKIPSLCGSGSPILMFIMRRRRSNFLPDLDKFFFLFNHTSS